MLVAGVDVGSTATKAVVLDENKRIAGKGLLNTGANVVKAAETACALALKEAGLEEWDIAYTVGTGYGRYKVPFGNTQATEISCHAKGAHFLFPATRTIVDIGGQDTKGIKVAPDGSVADFCMNDKCAAGTGRFLDASAQVLELALDDIGEVSLRATRPHKVTNVCTVFVESEIMANLAKGHRVEDILAGVHQAIASRSVGLLRRVGIDPEVTFTGGVSRNAGMVAALREKLNIPVNVSPLSQYMGALGAAIFAWERAVHAAEPPMRKEKEKEARP
jgi:(R)-2-hydroxyacyl-CoA dehydratese activating ATPase